MSVVAIIPARAGSKGVPGKNLRQVGGYSLLAHAIRAARGVPAIGRIVVSTDGAAIAAEARRHGAEVVHRPHELAGDQARSIDAVAHALHTLAIRAGTCVLLQPTSPLRTGADVQQAIAAHAGQDGGSVATVCACEHHPYKVLVRDAAGLRPLRDYATLEAPRQQLPEALRVNGAVYVNDIARLLSERSFFFPPLGFHEMPASRSLDIDCEQDLVLANAMMVTMP